MKKFLLAFAMLFAFAAASYAKPIARLDLNYYCRGQLRLVTPKLPPGVTVAGPLNYSNPRHAKICYYAIGIDLAKTQEIELEFEVVDTEGKDTVKLDPSLSVAAKGQSYECLSLEVADEPSVLVPCRITRWKSMIKGFVFVSRGERFTVKAKFKRPSGAGN